MNLTPPQTVLLRQAAGNRSIGAILVDTDRLSLADAERILALQQKEGLRFGDAGLKLGVLKPEDISFALARQYGYPYLLAGESNVADEITAAYEPFSPQVEVLRALRSQLMLRWFTGPRENRTLAIASPGRGEGRSWLAANLAVVFSQLGEHTLLIDADLRNSRQHSLFGIKNRSGLSSILSSRGEVSTIQRVASFVDLSVLPSGPIPPNPQELLGRPLFAKLLDELAGEFGVIIIDTPAAAEYADAQTIATRASGALLLARKHTTSIDALGSLADNLRQTGVQLVGGVVSEF
jgi:protein-tyrosine kinase